MSKRFFIHTVLYNPQSNPMILSSTDCHSVLHLHFFLQSLALAVTGLILAPVDLPVLVISQKQILQSVAFGAGFFHLAYDILRLHCGMCQGDSSLHV